MMSTKAWATVAATGCAVLASVFLVSALYQSTSRKTVTNSRHWTPATQPAPDAGLAPQPTALNTKVQVGRLSDATKKFETKALIVR